MRHDTVVLVSRARHAEGSPRVGNSLLLTAELPIDSIQSPSSSHRCPYIFEHCNTEKKCRERRSCSMLVNATRPNDSTPNRGSMISSELATLHRKASSHEISSSREPIRPGERICIRGRSAIQCCRSQSFFPGMRVGLSGRRSR
ncbi:uncharacterized protein LOC143145467 [Ptiloglossa arizonensis]|uniref:uncharacterized protein LOC143145467 n=1 Tax=Ptiloglossa arizonensis TaxID=3350558 RepID=UPI003FA0690F